jgi:hypothetical protein
MCFVKETYDQKINNLPGIVFARHSASWQRKLLAQNRGARVYIAFAKTMICNFTDLRSL